MGGEELIGDDDNSFGSLRIADQYRIHGSEKREGNKTQTIAMAIVSDLVMGMEPGLMAMRTPERIMIVRTRVS